MAETVKNIYYLVLIVAALYCLFSIKKVIRSGGTLLAIALLLTLFTVLAEAVPPVRKLFAFKPGGLLWVYNVYTIAIVSVYLLILKRSLGARYSNLINLVVSGFVLFGLYNLFLGQGFRQFNHYTIMVGASLLILGSLLYFRSRFDNLEENLLRSWYFWVATGLLMYFTGTLLYFGFMHYLSRLDNSWLVKLNIMFQVMNVLLYSLFGVALLCLTPRQK